MGKREVGVYHSLILPVRKENLLGEEVQGISEMGRSTVLKAVK